MLTYRKAKELLEVGDDVYIIENGKIETLRIKRIFSDSLYVRGGFLPFDTVGEDWWLTKTIAKRKLERGRK